MFGITLSVKTPVYLMLLFDFVIAVYLFLIYLIPHMLGNLVVALLGFASMRGRVSGVFWSS
ncbi:hypothetical protein Cantr_01276 [Candida viswanathii]|uniref:Uncharacterized protein n=1 Tax=Candida viswanathii TaxID=5486 RepID=A0A367YIP1_9ASCO|nr:hypothetical protein Cantr_01276 [Candida viswanathii]